MTTAALIAKELREGLANTTPGPWKWGPKVKSLCGDGMWFAKISWTVKSPRNEADAAHFVNTSPDRIATLIEAFEAMGEALKLAEDVLSRRPYSTDIWPNGMHPQSGIDIIRDALAKAGL